MIGMIQNKEPSNRFSLSLGCVFSGRRGDFISFLHRGWRSLLALAGRTSGGGEGELRARLQGKTPGKQMLPIASLQVQSRVSALRLN